MKIFSTIWNKSTPMIGLVSATIGFGSDILQPFAPLTSYVFFSTAFASSVILIIMIIRSSLRASLIKSFVFTITMMICSGGFYLLNDKNNTDTGVIAGVFPAIQNIQSSLGIVEKNIEDLKKLTKENVQETKNVKLAVEDSTKQIVQSITMLQKEFASLSKMDGIISDPKNPEEFYHNARLQEQKGDFLNARKSYYQFFNFKLNFVDPHLRYQTFIKIQEGLVGAREIYMDIYSKDNRPIINFIRILLFENPQKLNMLLKFIETNPDFAPAYYKISEEYSVKRKGTQSLTDKKNELRALNKFIELVEKGKFFRFFIDKVVASEWVADAKSRLKLLSVIEEIKDLKTVKLIPTRDNRGWNIRIEILEQHREIFYKLPEMDDFKSLGFLNFKNSNGLQMARSNMIIKCPVNPDNSKLLCENTMTEIKIKYIDISKVERGPFIIKFDGKDRLKQFCDDLLINSYGNNYEKLLNYGPCEITIPNDILIEIKKKKELEKKERITKAIEKAKLDRYYIYEKQKIIQMAIYNCNQKFWKDLHSTQNIEEKQKIKKNIERCNNDIKQKKCLEKPKILNFGDPIYCQRSGW